MINKIINISFILSLFFTSVYSVDIKNATEAVNIAGKQRMFTQRMLKDYSMIGMKNTFGSPDEDLKKTMSKFEDSMVSLIEFAKKDTTKKSVENVKVIWTPIKSILSSEPTIENVGKLQEDLEVLLKATDATLKYVASETK